MTVISDTTPIISLIKINRLDLLQKLFGEILISQAVYRELTTNVIFENEARIVKGADFLKTSPVQNRKGRKVAQKLGIKITGTVGVLLQAYDEQMITSDEIKAYLAQLKNSNIRLSDSLIQEAVSLL